MSKTIGIIGGMGPEAALEVAMRILKATPARDDSDHIHTIIDNNPKIPSRIAHLIDGTGEDPLPVLQQMAQGLQASGADFLIIPCNTAHHYLDGIRSAVNIPVLDMIELASDRLSGLSPIGLLASPAIRLTGIYENIIKQVVYPETAMENRLLTVIRDVKAGRAGPQQHASYNEVATHLAGKSDGLIIACTELSVLGLPRLENIKMVDAVDCLVEAAIRHAGD